MRRRWCRLTADMTCPPLHVWVISLTGIVVSVAGAVR